MNEERTAEWVRHTLTRLALAKTTEEAHTIEEGLVRVFAENARRAQANEDAEAEVERLRAAKLTLTYVCAACGAIASCECESVDSGTELTCDRCQRDTVVLLVTGVEYVAGRATELHVQSLEAQVELLRSARPSEDDVEMLEELTQKAQQTLGVIARRVSRLRG